MADWDNENLPENHQLFKNIKFVAIVEGTWNRKKNDGTNETAKKWDYITEETEDGPAMQVSVYSSTDHESLEKNVAYDIIVKRNVGKDGTFYGYSLKGFGPQGQPIPKKEPQSRFQKTLMQNNKAEALKAAVMLFTNNKEPDPDGVLMVADIFEAWLKGEYTPIDKNVFDDDKKESKKTAK